MKCVNHPENDAQAICAICNAPICGECLVELRSKNYCRHCLEEKIGVLKSMNNHRSKLLVLLISLLPGAGYMYLGLMNRGLQTMIIFFGTIFIAAMTGIEGITALVLPVTMFYSIFDTLQLAGRMNEGVFIEDKPLIAAGEHANWHNLLGYGLVGIGILALANNFLPELFDYRFVHKLLSPLLIIAVGIFILYRSLRRRKNDGSEREI
ncbi:hypothetical protein [Pelotomaculum sp. PtaB.Bin117]|uniref:B-box zinc finger protein n=1 Tax=Pelotomaculum sp. PtaB.Bin117 TaxID=1811694 RepID=UPI0009D541E3|nr:hypothetical protein [Pelotomaculum sp. PtaB.Bin117]OPX89387.1 MAG: hypothetical protein A4E54_00961 [Pelotomaculum sp. PtaB.Bin117]OPY61800.1 MAG: hypothetical protein A4E56_01812 [Pelotomaculum sp. PtaU1.Bin065]